MESTTHERYEYARKRIKQKKSLYFHCVLFLVGSLFMFIANKLMDVGQPNNWFLWISTAWFFFFILHFIKVYITDRFMNKEWERAQIDKLIIKQEIKIKELERQVQDKNNV
jgi:phosphotransferase system  glucose/maltose/N-acetylglucosamine-specific IIC component